MPIASSVNTVVVSSVLTTVTVQLDFDSVAKYLPPITVPLFSCWRKPGNDTMTSLFRGSPQFVNEMKILKTGAYATFIDNPIYAAASAAFVSAKLLLLPKTEYIVKTNGTIGFINYAADVSLPYAGIDAAGIAALQPMCMFTLLGIGHFSLLAQNLPASLPSWAHYQPFHAFYYPQVMGPVANPVFYSPAFATPPFFQGSTPYGVARTSSFANASYGAINLVFGLTDPFLVYFKQFNVLDGVYVGSPRVTPTVTWYDSGGVLISITTLTTLTFSQNARNVGVDRDFGLAADVDLSALTPPTTARYYSVAIAAVNYSAQFIMSYLVFSDFRKVGGCYAASTQINIEGGGYVPGLMTDP